MMFLQVYAGLCISIQNPTVGIISWTQLQFWKASAESSASCVLP